MNVFDKIKCMAYKVQYFFTGELPSMNQSAYYGHIKSIEFILDKGVGVDAPDDDVFTPLYIAASNNKIEMVKFLLSRGADPDIKCVEFDGDIGFTALDVAIEKKNVEICGILIEAGATFEYLDMNGQTPLTQAVLKNNLHIVNLLLDNGANLNQINRFGKTALQIAKNHEFLEMLDFINNYHSEKVSGRNCIISEDGDIEQLGEYEFQGG